MSQRLKELNPYFVVVFLIVIAALLRLYMLTSQSLWMDEGSSLAMTDTSGIKETIDGLWSVAGGDKYQVSYFYLLSLWRTVIGDSQFALQLFSVIPGVITPLLIYFSVKSLFGHRHALYSTLFVIFSAYCVSYSQEVRPYAFLLCLAALQLLVIIPGLKKGKKKLFDKILFALVTLLCCSSSIFLLGFTLAMALAHLLAYRNIQAWIFWWRIAAMASIPAVLYYLNTPAATNLSADAINSVGMPLWENTLFALYSHLAGQTYGPSINVLRDSNSFPAVFHDHLLSLSFLAVLSAILAWNALRNILFTKTPPSSQPHQHFFLLLFLISLLVAVVFAKLTSIHWMPRHSFYLMVPISVLLPLGAFHQLGSTHTAQEGKIATWTFSSWSLSRHIGKLCFASLLVANLYSVSNYFHKSEYWRDDYRSAAQYLTAHVGDKDASIMLWGEPRLLSYYGHSSVESLWRLEEPTLIMDRINSAILESNNVFVSINRFSSWLRHSVELRSLLSTVYDIESVVQFNNFSIYKLVKSNSSLAQLQDLSTQ